MLPGAILPVTETDLDMSTIDLRDALREIDSDSWLVGDRLIVKRSSYNPNALWTDPRGRAYELVDAPSSLPASMPLPLDSRTRQVPYDGPWLEGWVEEQYAVFNFDGVVRLKVTAPHPSGRVTAEHTTLEWLAGHDFGFATPRVLHSLDAGSRHYVFSTCVPGKSLKEAWPNLNGWQKQTCLEAVAGFITAMAAITSDTFGGVDQGWLFDPSLDVHREPMDFSTENLVRNCVILGIHETPYVFTHNDIQPSNIRIEIGKDNKIKGFGIINWERAGFVPAPWIRTKLRGCVDKDSNTQLWDLLKEAWCGDLATELEDSQFEDRATTYVEWVKQRQRPVFRA